MNRFYLSALLVFTVIRSAAICVHFLGNSPYGGRLVDDPRRFLLNAIAVETAVLIFFTLLFAVAGYFFTRVDRWIRHAYLLFMPLYLIFGQFDLEVVRWLGEHVNFSYLRNYLGRSDPIILGKLLSSDALGTFLAALFMVLPVVAALSLWRKPPDRNYTWKRTGICLALFALLASSPTWFMHSDKRWRRIKPAAFGITYEFLREISGVENPRNPKQAYGDLMAYIRTGRLAEEPLTRVPENPMWDSSGWNQVRAERTVQEFRALPPEEKPNIIYIVFETWRGWKSHLGGDTSITSYMPQLDSILLNEAYLFPFAHSIGFPSVEGAVGTHLGIWPHFRKIFISTHLSIRSLSLPQVFRQLGYHSEIYIGADPSFSNLTPWFKRWYDYFEYSPNYSNDGPLVNRFIQALDTASRHEPFYLATWTVTCHPPYRIPDSEGIPVAKTNPKRYEQALRYTDKHLARLLRYLKNSPLWEKSIIAIVSDHSQPQLATRNNTEIAGAFTPGHTWIPIAILGGWKDLPEPQVIPVTVSQMDIAPTLLDLVRVRMPNHFMGRTLLDPKPREQLSFRWGHVARITDEDRALFYMFSDEFTHYTLDKTFANDYALLEGHRMKISPKAPYFLDVKRYKDMIRAYGELLKENRLAPEGVYTPGMGAYRRID